MSQSSVSASTQGCIFFVDLRSDLNSNSAPLWPGWYRRQYVFWVQRIISKMALRWHRGDITVPNCWIKSLFLFYFRTKIFSSLHNIMSEPLMQMEYSDDAFHTFMDLNSAIYLAVNGSQNNKVKRIEDKLLSFSWSVLVCFLVYCVVIV